MPSTASSFIRPARYHTTAVTIVSNAAAFFFFPELSRIQKYRVLGVFLIFQSTEILFSEFPCFGICTILWYWRGKLQLPKPGGKKTDLDLERRGSGKRRHHIARLKRGPNHTHHLEIP